MFEHEECICHTSGPWSSDFSTDSGVLCDACEAAASHLQRQIAKGSEGIDEVVRSTRKKLRRGSWKMRPR